MDEIFFVVSGFKDVVLLLNLEVRNYFQEILYLDVNSDKEVMLCNGYYGICFVGVLIVRIFRDSLILRVVYKLKEKVKLFVFQK